MLLFVVAGFFFFFLFLTLSFSHSVPFLFGWMFFHRAAFACYVNECIFNFNHFLIEMWIGNINHIEQKSHKYIYTHTTQIDDAIIIATLLFDVCCWDSAEAAQQQHHTWICTLNIVNHWLSFSLFSSFPAYFFCCPVSYFFSTFVTSYDFFSAWHSFPVIRFIFSQCQEINVLIFLKYA